MGNDEKYKYKENNENHQKLILYRRNLFIQEKYKTCSVSVAYMEPFIPDIYIYICIYVYKFHHENYPS